MFKRKKCGREKGRILKWNFLWVFYGFALLFSMILPVFSRFDTAAIYNRDPNAHLALITRHKQIGAWTVKVLADTLTLKLLADKDPIAKLEIREIITHYGYPVEEHKFHFSDGYLATLHRIPGAKGSANSTADPSKRGVPVLLQHGLFTTGISWLHLGPINLPFLLADNGFDVFIASQRGSTIGMEHKTMKKESQKFWKFGMDEIAQFEIPGLIDYILSLTQYPKLHYVSYSVGAANLLLALAIQPAYNEKIERVSFLAPVGYFNSTTSPIFTAFSSLPLEAVQKFVSPEFARKNMKSLPNKDLPPACQVPLGHSFCSFGYLLIVGNDYMQNNFDALARHALHISFTPPWILIQLLQWKSTGKMSYYDYGKKENMKKYGQVQSPDYNLGSIRTPIQAFINTADVVASVTDALRTLKEIGPFFVNPTTANLNRSSFNHLDFMFNSKAPDLIYRHVVHFLKTGEPSADPPLNPQVTELPV